MKHIILRSKTTKNLEEVFYKSKLVFSVMILFFCGSSFAQSPEELMQQGNKHYQAEQFEDAIESYQKYFRKVMKAMHYIIIWAMLISGPVN